MSDLNGVGQVPDLGAIRQRQREKEQLPGVYGRKSRVRPAAVQAPNGQLSFRDALDRAALILSVDGWAITEVKQCAFVGGDQGGNAIFQVIATVSEMGV